MATENGFVDRVNELNFILTKTDGSTRTKLLGIKRIHYVDSNRAKEWYDALKSEMDGCSPEAFQNLDYLYTVLTH